MTTALVTGAAGPIGAPVVAGLRRDGAEVRCLRAVPHDPAALTGTLRGVELLVHFGPGLPTILDAARAGGAPLRHAIVASSHAVYGEGATACRAHHRRPGACRSPADLAAGRWDVGCPECGRPSGPAPTPEEYASPATPHARSVLRRERLAHALGAAHEVATTVLRLAAVYGAPPPGAGPRRGFVATAARMLLRRQPVPVDEDGGQLRDFVHIDDVVRAVLRVAGDRRAYAGTYNVGTGIGTDPVAVVSALAALLDVDAEVWLPGRHRPGRPRHLIADATRLRALGWRPEVELVDGLEDYAAWLRR